LEVFLDNIQVLFLEGVGHAVEKNNLDLDIFIKILKMSCDVQQKESEDKKGILTKISFEKKSFVNKLLFIKKVI
jgi:murein endopeptidase